VQQTVDPFMPVSVKSPAHKAIPSRNPMPHARPTSAPRRALDGILTKRLGRHQQHQKSDFVHPTNIHTRYAHTNQPTISLIKPTSSPQTHSAVNGSQNAAKPQPQSLPVPKPRVTSVSRNKKLINSLQLPLIILASVIVGYLIQSLLFGEIAIAIYAVGALAFKVASKTTYILAMLSLLAIVALEISNPGGTLAQNFAVYTFLLLIIGTVSLGREVRVENA
jgi:hypothetical protein